jgi:hypothetical protein
MLDGRDWFRMEGASVQMIEALRAATPEMLPEAYLQLLSFSNGGEGPLPVNPFNLCLLTAEEVIEMLSTANYGQPNYDGFLVFGGNGGGEYLAFDMRAGKPWAIVTMDMVAGSSSCEMVASNFEEFLDLIGVGDPRD